MQIKSIGDYHKIGSSSKQADSKRIKGLDTEMRLLNGKIDDRKQSPMA